MFGILFVCIRCIHDIYRSIDSKLNSFHSYQFSSSFYKWRFDSSSIQVELKAQSLFPPPPLPPPPRPLSIFQTSNPLKSNQKSKQSSPVLPIGISYTHSVTYTVSHTGWGDGEKGRRGEGKERGIYIYIYYITLEPVIRFRFKP